MQNPLESFEDFTRYCAQFGVVNPFTRLQWHVTVKHLTEQEAYGIACDVNSGFPYAEAVTANTQTMTRGEQRLWDQGYRYYEIYTYNDTQVKYLGEIREPGTVSCWEIKYVFSTREKIKTFPYFECVIGLDRFDSEVEVWHG